VAHLIAGLKVGPFCPTHQ